MELTSKFIVSMHNETSIAVWQDEIYTIAGFQEVGCIRLDIVRHDLKDGLTWDELNKIKIACGFADYDGIEFFPKEKDIMNTANIRHLYLFKEDLPWIRRN